MHNRKERIFKAVKNSNMKEMHELINICCIDKDFLSNIDLAFKELLDENRFLKEKTIAIEYNMDIVKILLNNRNIKSKIIIKNNSKFKTRKKRL